MGKDKAGLTRLIVFLGGIVVIVLAVGKGSKAVGPMR
jgi:hypothetical protein